MWGQTVYTQTVWNPDAELGTQTVVSKKRCDKYHVIKLKSEHRRKTVISDLKMSVKCVEKGG